MIRNCHRHEMTMADYDPKLPVTAIVFPSQKVVGTLAAELSAAGLTQIHTAETEKYAHVTYYFDGGENSPAKGEDQLLVPSPQVATYDLKPKMSIDKVEKELLLRIGKYDFIVVNFANPDMVAHTGVIDATIRAMECTDECIGRIVEKVLSLNGAIIITADHGNAEEMIDPQTGNIDTKHSTNPVPILIIMKDLGSRELPFGILADVTPTMLALLGISKPVEMTGRDLMV